MGTVLHQRLMYPVITSDASTIEWFAVWSSRFEQRGYQLKVDILVHARTLSVNVSRSGMDSRITPAGRDQRTRELVLPSK